MATARQGVPLGVWLVYLNVVLYALCYQLQMPIEPFLWGFEIRRYSLQFNLGSAWCGCAFLCVVKRLGASNAAYGKLQSFFSAIQTVGAPVVGVLLGRYGTRAAFVIMFLASALSYGILSQTDSMTMLYLSKVPSLLQHGFLVAQTAIADQTADGATRLTALGYLTTAYTVGASVGPAVGGFLGANGNYFIGAKCAVAGSLLSATIAFFAPEERAKDADRAAAASKAAAEGRAGIMGGLNEMYTTAMMVFPLLATKIIVSVGNAMYQGSMTIVLRDNFHFTEANMGMYMSSFMVSGGIFSAICVRPIADRYPGRQILVTSVGGMAVAFAVRTLAGMQIVEGAEIGVYALAWVACTFIASLCGHMLAITITSESTTLVPDDRRGTLMGLEHGGFSSARIIGPSLGIMLMERGTFWHVDAAILCIVSSVLAFWVTSKGGARKADKVD